MTSPPRAPLGDAERIAWLRLIRSENVGTRTFQALIGRYGTAIAALEALPELAARGGRRIKIASADEAEHEIAALDEIGGRFIASAEAEFPEWLRHADGSPPLLTVRGDTACLTRPMVAIVGARNASVAGRRMAALLAEGIGRAAYVIASGLARGIDAAAHEAALAAGTVAVFAGGLDRLYPPENARLADRILASGGVHLSEMPMGWEPRARDFPRRNRIVSGLALATVVVEAAERSGSLITARLAAEQGRLVFAVPGSPLDPRAAGSNRLLKEGASIVTEADDVLSALDPMLARPSGLGDSLPLAPPSRDAEDGDRRIILEALGPTPVEVDDLIRFTGLKPAIPHLVLLELDLAGRIEWHPGQRVSLV